MLATAQNALWLLLPLARVHRRSHVVSTHGAAAGAGPRPRATAQYHADGVALLSTFLAPADFAAVVADCRSLRSKLKAEAGSIAIGRLGHIIDRKSTPKAFAALTATAVAERLNSVAGLSAPLGLSDYPIEFRLYRSGSGMDWHQDDQLFDEPQCEIVLTLENTSDSHTEWIDAAGKLHSTWMAPNSALLVRAGETGARHRVEHLRHGERTIVKMVFANPAAERLPRFWAHLDSFPGLRDKQRPSRQRVAGRVARAAHKRGRRR